MPIRRPRGVLYAILFCLVDCRHVALPEATTQSADAGLSTQPLAFDVNDTAILFPNRNGQFYPNIPLDAAGLAAIGVRDLWPQATAFKPLMDFAGGKDFAGDTAFLTDLTASTNAQPLGQFGLSDTTAPVFNPVHRQIGVSIRNGQETNDTEAQVKLNASFTDPSKWRVVSLRIDPCAQAQGSTCNVEMRLIAQAVGGTSLHALDRSAHLLYHLGKLDLANARLDPALPRAGMTRSLRNLTDDLQKIKALAAAAGGSTDGQPLGAHPGLAAELKSLATPATAGPLAQAVIKLINDYSAGGLSSVTSFQMITEPSPWVLFQGSVVNNVWHPTGITGPNQQFSIRFMPLASTFVPAPLSTPSMNALFDPDGPGLTAPDAVAAYQIDNPGHYGVDDGKPKISTVTTDCLSCHTTGSKLSSDTISGSAANVPTNLAAMYIPAAGITAYPAPRSVSQFVWNFRGFGAFGGTSSPALMSRTINEAAEATRFFDEDIMPKIYGAALPKHGFTCVDSAGSDHALLHAKLWDCLVVQSGEFAQCVGVICDASPPAAAGAL